MWLNYHHLFYFWVVAKEGSIARASAELRLAEATLSEQIRALRASLGEERFERKGRAPFLLPTEGPRSASPAGSTQSGSAFPPSRWRGSPKLAAIAVSEAARRDLFG